MVLDTFSSGGDSSDRRKEVLVPSKGYRERISETDHGVAGWY